MYHRSVKDELFFNIYISTFHIGLFKKCFCFILLDALLQKTFYTYYKFFHIRKITCTKIFANNIYKVLILSCRCFWLKFFFLYFEYKFLRKIIKRTPFTEKKDLFQFSWPREPKVWSNKTGNDFIIFILLSKENCL